MFESKKASEVFVFGALFSILVSLVTGGVLYTVLQSAGGERGVSSTATQTPVIEVATGAVEWLKNLETWVRQVARSVSPSVVSIVISKDVQMYKTDPFGFFYEPSWVVRKQVGGWSGFFANKDGYILTNRHVVSDGKASYSILLSDGRELIGKIVALDANNDIAVIRAYEKDGVTPFTSATPLTSTSDISSVEVGSFVIAIGNALAEFQNTLTFWVVSGLGRSIDAWDRSNGQTEQLTGLIQTDAAINPGNSWGPLVDISGRVVGINTAVSAGANGIGFAIPLSEKTINNVLKSAIQYGAIKRAFLGVRYVLLDESVAQKLSLKETSGAYIGSTDPGTVAVVADSPASKAGLETGDIIKEVDGKKINNRLGIKELLSEKFPGDQTVLTVLKKSGKTETIRVELGAQ